MLCGLDAMAFLMAAVPACPFLANLPVLSKLVAMSVSPVITFRVKSAESSVLFTLARLSATRCMPCLLRSSMVFELMSEEAGKAARASIPLELALSPYCWAVSRSPLLKAYFRIAKIQQSIAKIQFNSKDSRQGTI